MALDGLIGPHSLALHCLASGHMAWPCRPSKSCLHSKALMAWPCRSLYSLAGTYGMALHCLASALVI